MSVLLAGLAGGLMGLVIANGAYRAGYRAGWLRRSEDDFWAGWEAGRWASRRGWREGSRN